MTQRVPPSERTSERLRDVLQEGLADGSDIRSEVIRLAVRKIVEEALEAEVTDVLGRDYYERPGGAGRGYRNGYRTGRLRSAEGPIAYATPHVSDRREPFRSRLRGQLDGRTEALEQLAIEHVRAGTLDPGHRSGLP